MTTTELKTKLDSFKRFYSIHQYKSIGEYHLYLSDGCQFLHENYEVSWLFNIVFDFLHQNKWFPGNYTKWTLVKQPYGLFDLKVESLLNQLYYQQFDIDEQFPFDEFV